MNSVAKLSIVLVAAFATITAGDARDLLQAPGSAPSTKTVTETAEGVPDLSILVAALVKTGLAGTLNDTSLVATVFAPINAAFVALENKLGYTADALLNSSILKPTLLYHVVPKVAAQSTSLINNEVLPTLLPGQDLTVYLNGPTLTVSGVQTAANVTQANILASKAVVHIIDAVLLPAQSALSLAPTPAPATPEAG